VDPASVLTGLGLSGAAGLNAWLPLFLGALLTRTGGIDLGDPFEQLSTNTGLIVLGSLFVVDLIGDKVPAIDHVLHAAGTVIAPVSGAILFAGETDATTLVAAVVGGSVAGGIHLERAAFRPASTATTAGAGNPVVSLIEDLGALVLFAAAFVVPLLAAALAILLLVFGFLIARAVTRRVRKGRPPGPAPPPSSV
jgi:Domain of unknown function (DUF4126)